MIRILPLNNDPGMFELLKEVAIETVGEENTSFSNIRGSGCTDMGDVSLIVPTIHPYMGGASGTSHGANYYITDPETACVSCAKFQIMYLEALLKNGAEKGKKIISDFKPTFASIKEYIDFADSLSVERDTVTYNEDGSINIRYC